MIKNAIKRMLKNYYEQERPEQDRLYDFTKPYSYYYHKKRMELILELLKKYVTPNCLLLDVGCGDSSYLNHINCEYVVGLDISRSKLRYARRKIKNMISLRVTQSIYL